MYEIKVESAFKADYARVMKRHPRLRGEFKEAVSELMRTGAVPDEYGPHELSNPGENYNGHIDFHLLIIAGRLPRRSTLSCHTVPRRAASC